MKRIYLSGAVTSLGIEKALKVFSAYEDKVNKYAMFSDFDSTTLKYKKDDVKAVNPLKEVPYKKGRSWFGYMIRDLKVLKSCDGIFMLPNYKESLGAKIELFFAKLWCKDIYNEELEYERIK